VNKRRVPKKEEKKVTVLFGEELMRLPVEREANALRKMEIDFLSLFLFISLSLSLSPLPPSPDVTSTHKRLS